MIWTRSQKTSVPSAFGPWIYLLVEFWVQPRCAGWKMAVKNVIYIWPQRHWLGWPSFTSVRDRITDQLVTPSTTSVRRSLWVPKFMFHSFSAVRPSFSDERALNLHVQYGPSLQTLTDWDWFQPFSERTTKHCPMCERGPSQNTN